MDVELYRRLLASKTFSYAGKEMREEIAILIKNLLTKSYHLRLLEPLLASRLIPLNKNPGVRPIGVGEVLRRIIGKVVNRNATEEIIAAAGSLQTCAGHWAGAEAAIHAMKEIFENDETDAVILIDASNAFNRMNRTTAIHNIQILCPNIAMFIVNTYRKPARLFIADGGGEIKSREGTTQGDPLAMPWYSINTVIIINQLRIQHPEISQVWLADDATAAGKLKSLFEWYMSLVTEGNKYGYFVNKSKSWLIVKNADIEKEAESIFGNNVRITSEGKRHLGAVIGRREKNHFVKN